MTADNPRCEDIQDGFCASRANGRPRCKKGHCILAEASQPAPLTPDDPS